MEDVKKETAVIEPEVKKDIVEPSKTITKSDIARVISEKSHIPKQNAYDIVCDMFDCIIDYVMSGKRIEIRNFGIFVLKETKEREGRNPQNGQPIKIPAKSTIKFKPSKVISKDKTVEPKPA